MHLLEVIIYICSQSIFHLPQEEAETEALQGLWHQTVSFKVTVLDLTPFHKKWGIRNILRLISKHVGLNNKKVNLLQSKESWLHQVHDVAEVYFQVWLKLHNRRDALNRNTMKNYSVSYKLLW